MTTTTQNEQTQNNDANNEKVVRLADLYVQPEAQPYLLLSTDITRMAMAGESPETIRAYIAEQLYTLGGSLENSAIMAWDESFDFYQDILRERKRRRDENVRELRWPWASWNAHIDPPDPGMLMIIGAPDGVGKTVVVEDIAEQIARDGGHAVVFHLELSPEIMMDRRTARNAGIDRRELKMSVDDEIIRLVRDTDMRLMSWPGEVTYVHAPGWSVSKISAVIRALNAKKEIDLVIIDYLQKIGYVKDQLVAFGSDVHSRAADTVERIKTLAEQELLPIVLVSQLRKDAKNASAVSLNREMLFGSGSTSNRANIVVLMNRERDEEEGIYTSIIHTKIDKNSMGSLGAFMQIINGPRFDIRDLTDSGDSTFNDILQS